MSRVSSDRIASLLGGEHALLDEIFGGGNYEIKDLSPDVAAVQSDTLQLTFAYDRRRARDVVTSILPPGASSTSLQHSTYTLARFLGEDLPGLPTDSRGFVTIPPEDQIRNDLRWIARFVKDIFSDPQRTRDAANFEAGYSAAYNDWASRNGAWVSTD